MAEWSSEQREIVASFRYVSELLPRDRAIELRPGETVAVESIEVFLENLRREIALGPTGPRARGGSLMRHLRRLRELHGDESATASVANAIQFPEKAHA